MVTVVKIMLTDEEIFYANLMEHYKYGYNSGIQDGINCGMLAMAFLVLIICIWFLFWRNRKR